MTKTTDFFTRIYPPYPQHYETLLDDRCGYKQLHKLNTVIVQGAPLCIKYNFSSYIFICFNTKAGFTSWSLWTIWFSLLPFSPEPVSPQTRNIKYKIFIILYHIIWQFNWVIWLNFLLYFGPNFHFLSMSCIEIFIHSTLNYWCWILSFLFFQIFWLSICQIFANFVNFCLIFSDNLKSLDLGSWIIGLRILSPRISDPRIPRTQDPQS